MVQPVQAVRLAQEMATGRAAGSPSLRLPSARTAGAMSAYAPRPGQLNSRRLIMTLFAGSLIVCAGRIPDELFLWPFSTSHLPRRSRPAMTDVSTQPPTSKAAERQRRYRQRRSEQRGVLQVEADLFMLSDLLVEKGFLQQWDSEDRSKVTAALQEALSVWSRYA